MNASSGDPSPLYPQPPVRDVLLRVALLLDEPAVPAWIARIVQEIQASGFCEVSLAIVGAKSNDGADTPRNSFLYNAYLRNEIRRRRSSQSAFLERDLSEVLTDTKWLRVIPRRDKDKICLAPGDLQKVRDGQPDVLLRFGFRGELCAELISAARHGVWMFGHGNNPETAFDSNYLRSIEQGDPVSASELWQLPPTLEAPRLLYRSLGSTHPHSLEIGQEIACRKSSAFVMRCLRQLAATGRIALVQPQTPPARRPLPGNLEMARFLARNVAYKAGALIRNHTSVEHWSVLWRKGRLLDPDTPAFADVRTVPCPQGHFYADPFIFRHQGRDWLFVEDYDYARGHADIAVIPWGEQGPAEAARTVLRLPEHLSYPHVFAWNDAVYMVPEIGDAGGPVRLFRARNFPDDWELIAELLSGHLAVDATLHEHRGRWYLFANIAPIGGSENDELFLFHAETPLGPFAPHPQNPVVSDARHARPAGRLFTRAGRLIRPSQDCAGGYGRAVVFNEVLALDPEHYRERSIGRLEPSPSQARKGYHTYACLDDFEVVDFKQPKLRWSVGA